MLGHLRRRAVACALSVAASTCALPLAIAQETPPANTLMDMRRQFGACMSGRPIGPFGSAVTIVLMMKRDGSIFGKPRITFSRLEGDEEARRDCHVNVAPAERESKGSALVQAAVAARQF